MARPSSSQNPVRVRFAAFELDEANARLLRDGQPVALAPTPFDLLCALARQPGTLLTKDALLDAVWGHQFVSESVLKTAISDLRSALGDDPREPRFIETVPRRGYRFIAPVAAADAPAQAAGTIGAAQAPANLPPPVSPHASTPAAAFGTAEPPATAFVGRTDALARLQRAWSQASGGQRALVWVAGEPGIGKTTLIERFIAGLGGAACARGQCVEHYGSGEPYLPVLEGLAELCRHDPALPALMRSVAPTWLLQLPWLSTADERDALRRELAGVGPDRMLREMGELLDRYTEQRPLLLVTEDLHWSDRATLLLLDYMARRRGRARLMWLASFRLAEVIALDHPLNRMRHELRLQRLCDEVVLDAFSETEVADFVARRSPSLAAQEGFVRALHERTDGVPLFVSSMVNDVMERSGDDAAVLARLAAVAVPENLVAIIDHYIARLPDDARTLLAAAAVCGVDFRAETLALALQRDVAEVAHACDALVREHVWLVGPRELDGVDATQWPYAFRHALFRQVLYDRTAPSARMQLHRQVGTALLRERAAGVAVAASELAMHFDRGRQPMAALRHYVEAAEAALLHFSPAACQALLGSAEALLAQAPDDAERRELALSLATLQALSGFHASGVGDDVKQAFERGVALLADAPAHPMRGRLLHGFGYILGLRGDYAQALQVAGQAEALSTATGDPGLLLAACIVRGEVNHMRGRTAQTRAWLERGLALVPSLDPASRQVFAADPQITLLAMQGIELLRSGLVAQGRAQVQRARALAQELRAPMTRLVAAWNEALFEVRLGRPDRVGALADELAEVVDEYGVALGRTACRWWRGWADAHQGQPLEGFRRIREAYDEHTRLGMRAGASEVLGYAAEALLLAGDLEGAQAQLDEALQLADTLGEGVYLPPLLGLQARLASARGQAHEATAALRRAIDEARSQEAPWFELQALVALCKQPGAEPADRQALQALIDRLPETHDTPLGEQARALLASPAH